MNSRQMMEEIDRLARLCEAKEREIAVLNEGWKSANQELLQAALKLEEAHAQIAMQAEALNKIKWHRKPGGSPTKYEYEVEVIAHNVLAATAKTVAAWRAKETEPLQVRLYRWAKTAGIFDANHLDKIQDELDELKESYCDEMEMADVLLALLLHAEQMGCLDLLAAAEMKFAIIQCRKYGDPDERGVVCHIDVE